MTDNKLIRQEHRLANAISKAQISGNRKSLGRATRSYLGSYASRYVAATEAIKTARRKPKITCTELAQRINPWIASNEAVRVDVKLRKNHDARFVLSFGLENQARQVLVRNALKSQWNISRDQTMFDGGRETAVRKLIEYYQQGYRHIKEVDIHRCYHSFSMEKIGNFLCMPETVVRHVLCGTSLSVIPSHSVMKEWLFYDPSCGQSASKKFEERFGDEWALARQGLVEGSKASPFAAELLLAPVCQACSDCGSGRVISYADNFLLLARTSSELATMDNVLRHALRMHPAGPLTVNPHDQENGLYDPFEFLGYEFQPNGDNLNVKWSPANERKSRDIRRRAHKLLASSMPEDKKEIEFANVCRRHLSRVRAFPSWRGAMTYHRRKMRRLRLHIASRSRGAVRGVGGTGSITNAKMSDDLEKNRRL